MSRLGIVAGVLLALGTLAACFSGQQRSVGGGPVGTPALPAERTRVVWVVDQSTSNEFTDPNHTRFAALDDALQTILHDPQAAVAAVGFSDGARTTGFTRNAADLFHVLNPSRVGEASDLGAGLGAAMQIIAEDLERTALADRDHTRYLVWVVADSSPSLSDPGSAKTQVAKDDAATRNAFAREVDALRSLSEKLTVHFRLGGEALPPALEAAFSLHRDDGRALYAHLAELGGGTFAEVANKDVARWP